MGRKRRGRPAGAAGRTTEPPSPRTAADLLMRGSLPELHPLRPRSDLLGLALLFAGVFVLYAASTPRTVMLEDDGLFITVAAFAGVGHPPGYPLYIALGWLASLVPFGSVAWRVHALSGLMGALTCVCIAWLVLRRTGNRPAAFLAGAVLAVSGDFWSQAIIADVYTTNTAVVFLAAALAQEAADARSTRLWVGAAAVYGLGLANHYPLLILASPLFLAWAVGAERDFRSRVHYLLPVAVLPAAALYGWMVWRSHQPVPVNFLGPIGSWGEFLSFVDRRIYEGVETSVNAGLADKLLYARHFATRALLQFGVAGGLISLWGAFASYRSGWRLGLCGEALALAASSFLLIALLGFDYEFRSADVIFRPYPLVAYGILALWLGRGLHALSLSRRCRPALPALGAACALAAAVLGVWNGRVNYRPHDRFAEENAQVMLDLAAEDGVFVLHGESLVGPIAYLHLVEGRRPNLRLLEYQGLLFSDRVVQPLDLPEQKSASWAGFLRDADQTVYSLRMGPAFLAAGIVHSGFFVESGGAAGARPGGVRVRAGDAAKAWFRELAEMPEPADPAIAVHRNELLSAYGWHLGLAQSNEQFANEHFADVLPLAEGNYWSLTGMAGVLASAGAGERALRLADEYLHEARRLAGGDRGKADRAREVFVEGEIARLRGDAGRARTLFRESLRLDRALSNPARESLEALEDQAGG